MPRLDDVPDGVVELRRSLPLPDFDSAPFVIGKPLRERRVAVWTPAGLLRRGDPVFEPYATDYRVIPGEIDANDLLLSHLSVNFDRSGFVQDHEVVFPLARLGELAADGAIGSVARYHFSFMGATDPEAMRPAAEQLARAMTGEGTNVALLVPV